MKITCPGCRKKYTVNDAKLASGIKSARCSACGHLIPLRKRPARGPSKSTPVVTVTCQYCGQSHRLRQDKIPPAAASIKCKSCRRPVPLSRATRVAPVHPLKKEASAPKSEPTGGKKAGPQPEAHDQIRFACASCGKRYKVSYAKIPPKITAVKCKACGHKVQLPPARPISADPGTGRPAEDRIRAGQPGSAGLMTDKPVAESRSAKPGWRIAAIIGILLVLTMGALVQLDYIKPGWVQRLLPESAAPPPDSDPPMVQEPFLFMALNVPSVLKALDNRLESDAKTPELQEMISLAKTIDLQQLDLYLFLGPNSRILPVITASGTKRQQLEDLLRRREPFSNYFVRQSDGRYRLKPNAVKNGSQHPLSAEPFQINITDGGASLAPASLPDSITQNPGYLASTSVARFSRTTGSRDDIAAIAVRLPDRINPGWEAKIQNHPAIQSAPRLAMVAGMGSAILSELTGSLETVDMLAMGFRFTGQHGRTLGYAQKFRSGVDGQKIYQQLAASNPADLQQNRIIANLIELFQDQRYEHRLDFKNNRLRLEFDWLQTEDEAFLTALSAATIGQIFAGAVDLAPSTGTVDTVYAAEPDLTPTVDAVKLRANAPQLIQENLFPGQYWDMGEDPRLTLDLDTLDLPNAALAELTYDVKSVRSPAGKDVHRVEETKIESRIQPGRLYPGSITITVKKGTRPEDLHRARIHFKLTVPSALEIIEFSARDKTGTVKEAAGIRITLGRLEKDVAGVKGSGGKTMHLIAYDKTGKALGSRESMSTPTSAAKRFAGLIDTLKVVVVREVLTTAFEVDADLNQGKPLVLSQAPEVPPRMRFNHQKVRDYADFSVDDLKNLTVKWREGRERAWSDSLAIELPRHPFSGHAAWEVHFFGKSSPTILAGTSAQDSTHISYAVDKGQLKQANAAFGKVRLSLHSDISRLVFVKEASRQPAPQSLPSGETVTVAFDKNEITFSLGQVDVIQTAGYDARGKRLKQDQFSRNRGGKRSIYFWGVPHKFLIDISAKTIERRIPFDIERRPVDRTAYAAYKETIENQRDVVKTIKAIDRARRTDRSYYGDDLAGLYYLHHSQQKKPLALISREIAHSDPAGQERFGYNVRPHKGYYFTVLSGVETNGVQKDYNRRSKKSRFSWQKGSITTTALTRHPDLVAIPEDDSQPTFFLQWGQVFMKPLGGEKLKYLPDGYYNKGWVEAKYLDD